MSYKTCLLNIDNEPYSFQVEGDFFWGNDELLFNENDSLISKMSWKSDGYANVPVFQGNEFHLLKASINENIIKAIKASGVKIDNKFTLDQYHKYITTDELHNQVINITRNLENEDFNFNIEVLVERFGAILGYELTSWLEDLGKSHIQIRISRPNSLDINPPHRDGYLSYYHNIINIWIPIEGCNTKSSLPVLPGSHLINENKILRTQSKGAKINGNTYYVPCILEVKDQPTNMVRPNPKEGEALIFTPYLIHGAAVNKNEDITRVALELRFPKIKN